MSRLGYTQLHPTVQRSARFQRISAAMHLDPDIHADRLEVIDFALKLLDLVFTTSHPLAQIVTLWAKEGGETEKAD